MEKLKCKECRKEIEGYNQAHVGFLMGQHRQMHERRNKKDVKEK